MTFGTGCDVKQLTFEDYYIYANDAWLLSSHLQKTIFQNVLLRVLMIVTIFNFYFVVESIKSYKHQSMNFSNEDTVCSFSDYEWFKKWL